MGQAQTYWKVVLRYGHVGIRKEVSIARHLISSNEVSIFHMREIAANMPGVKAKGVIGISKITEEEYFQGIKLERENFYLQTLFENKSVS